jgi:hypothetical protein
MDDIRSMLNEVVADFAPRREALERTIRRGRERRRRSRLVAVVTATAVAGAGIGFAWWAFSGVPARPPRPAAVGACSAGWQELSVPSPGNEQNVLAGVAVTPTDAWAVGWSSSVPPGWLERTPSPGSLGGPAPPVLHEPLVLHWDGATWSEVKAPNQDVVGGDTEQPTGGATLNAVAEVSPDDVWAVGGGQRPLIEHWDGHRWSIVPSPDVNLVDGVLVAVAGTGPNDAWAAGSGGTGGDIVPVIEHWDGTRWELTPIPEVHTRYSGVTDVAALSPTDAWAVGQDWDAPLALHWDGTSWAQVAVPNLRAIELSGVAAIAPDDVWAVGTDYRDVNGNGPAHAVLLHWDGLRWRLVDAPIPDGQTSLSDVSAAGANDVWVHGAGPDQYGNPSTQMFLHYDGRSWAIAIPPANAPDNSSWSDIATARDSVWFVGSSTRPGPYVSSMAFAARSCTG